MSQLKEQEYVYIADDEEDEEATQEYIEVEEEKPQVVVNRVNYDYYYQNTKECNKWISFVLCFFFGVLGAHKFYEGKIGMGFLYFFTAGLFGIGWLVDLVLILCKPDPYYVDKKN